MSQRTTKPFPKALYYSWFAALVEGTSSKQIGRCVWWTKRKHALEKPSLDINRARERGLLERGLYRKVHFLEILENPETLVIPDNPQTAENKGESCQGVCPTHLEDARAHADCRYGSRVKVQKEDCVCSIAYIWLASSLHLGHTAH